MPSKTRKNLIFYLPNSYKAQLDKIAKSKGITFKRLVMDIVYKQVLMHEPDKMNIYPDTKERTDSELAIAVRNQAEAINRLMTYIEENLSRKEF